MKTNNTPETKVPEKNVQAPPVEKKVAEKTHFKKPLWIFGWWKEILLMVINIVFIVLTLIYLAKLPDKAKAVKDQRNSLGEVKATLNLDLSKFEVESAKEKFDKLNALFPDQKKLLDFIGTIDELKTTGHVFYFAFASENTVKEKSGYIGYPFVVEFRGTLAEVSDGLGKFEKIPFLFKTINFSIERGEKDNQVVLRYGGFLYVSEKTSKN